MNRKQFALCGAMVTAAIGAIVGYSVCTSNFVLPFVAVVGGILALRLIKRRVDDVLEDERIYRISEKASRRVLEIFGIGSALTGVTLIALDKHQEVGYALAFSACIMILLYMIFYAYYSVKSLD
ncbi:MAG: hypothetical protein DRN03_01690 [Thermoplasmata archaeon]|nr:MAG: hypothetical protein DRN03_01690 [Thermoplasmata archaeon]